MNIFQRAALALQLLTGKALADLHPELSDREHLASMRSDQIAASPYSYLIGVANYGSYVWLRKAIKVLSDNFSALPVNVLRDGKVIDHPIARLLTGVNDVMSSGDLWQQWLIDMMLGGEEFWELVRDGAGQYVEIWPRQPHQVSVIPDAAGRRYRRVAGYKIEDNEGDPYTLPPDECIHFKFYNPANPWRGISPITAVRSSIIIDQLAQSWSRMFLKNSARPDYAIITPQGTTETERKNLIAQLKQDYGGAENAHEPIALEEGISDIKILSFPPKDIEWIEQRKLSRAEVAAIMGVPDEIMGYGRDTYENFDTALRVLWTLTIMPIASLRDMHLTEVMQRNGALKPGETIVSDYSGVSILKPDFGAKLTQAKALWDMGVPFNRIDELLALGVGRLVGGDVGYLPFSVAPVSSIANPPDAAQLSVRNVRRKGQRAPEYGSDEHKVIWDAFVKRVDPHEARLGRTVRALLVDQEKAVLANLRDEEKGAKSANNAASDPFDRAEWRAKFREKCDPIIAQTVQAAGDAAAADLDTFFSLEDPAVIEFLNDREQRFAQRVNETTWQELKNSLEEGIHLGESIPELEKRVTDVMALRKNQSKEAIARTEVVGASNGGTLEAWKQSDLVAEKMWIATFDDRVRETHADAHGQTVGIDDDFEVGNGSGPAPGQIGLPEEDIQCRCTMASVLK